MTPATSGERAELHRWPVDVLVADPADGQSGHVSRRTHSGQGGGVGAARTVRRRMHAPCHRRASFGARAGRASQAAVAAARRWHAACVAWAHGRRGRIQYRTSRREATMCRDCGCGEPEASHGDDRHITLAMLKDAAASGIEVEEAADRIHAEAKRLKEEGKIT